MDYPVKTLSQWRPLLLGFRKAAGLTQARMASRLGVAQQTYAQLEANPASASVERLFRVLHLLDVDMTLTQASTGAALTKPLPMASPAEARRRSKATRDLIQGETAPKSRPAAQAPKPGKAAKISGPSGATRVVSTTKKRENW